jgi:hypothetical protein
MRLRGLQPDASRRHVVERLAGDYSRPTVVGDALYLATASRLYLIATCLDRGTR